MEKGNTKDILGNKYTYHSFQDKVISKETYKNVINSELTEHLNKGNGFWDFFNEGLRRHNVANKLLSAQVR